MSETVGHVYKVDFKQELSAKMKFLFGFVGFAGFVLLWQTLSTLGSNPKLFPPPTRVVTALYSLFVERDFVFDIFASIKRIVISFSIAAIIALPLGLLLGSFPPFRAALGPIISSSRYLPATAFVPLFLMWLGTGEEQKIALLTVGVLFFLITLLIDNTMKVPKDFINSARTMGATRRQILWTVIVPTSLPAYIDTLRQMLAIGWTYLVVAEIVAATDGIGAMMMRAKRFVRVEDILAGIVIIGILGLLFDALFKLLHRWSFPYLRQKL